MDETRFVKVVIGDDGPSIAEFEESLRALAHPEVDVGVLQVGVHEAVLPPHLAHHLAARTNESIQDVLAGAGADRVQLISETEAYVLAMQRVPEDLQVRVVAEPPDGPLWHLERLGVRDAWAQVGGPDAIDWTFTGANGATRPIVVGHIDTGYTQHDALGFGQPGGTWIRTSQCRTLMYADQPDGFGPPPPQPDNGVDPVYPAALFGGHGTRIGATISGWTPGGKFYGIAPRVPHVVVRITDSVGINLRQFEFADALAYLVDEVGVDAVNCSLGIFPPSPWRQVKRAMEHARQSGVIVCCAAGQYVRSVCAPAVLPTAIAIAGITPGDATDGSADKPWKHSCMGPEVAFSGPAAQMRRPLVVRQGIGTDYVGGGDGTSYATAITTGSAALWLRRWSRRIDAKYGRTASRVEAFKAAVQATASKPHNWQPQPFGAGVIHVGRLCTNEQLALP